MESQGFTATLKDPDCDFTAAAGFRVDDCIAIGSMKELNALAKSVDAQYSITGLGEVRWVLGMVSEHDRPARMISRPEEAFIDSILALFNLIDATTVATPSPQKHTFPRSTVQP